MEQMQNMVVWFEIPVTDMDRAIRFYESVLGVKLERHPMGAFEMAWFPMIEGAAGAAGALMRHQKYVPSVEGPLVYFSARSGDLANELARVESSGGKILVSKTQISKEYGYMAVILDTEGGRVALHSMQ